MWLRLRSSNRFRSWFWLDFNFFLCRCFFSSRSISIPIDIKFDAKNQESSLKEDALNKYQENCYLLGKIFAAGEDLSESSGSEELSDEETRELTVQIEAMRRDFAEQMSSHNSA